MKKHNGIISFWKFIFCFVIIIFHVGEYQPSRSSILFRCGSIGVEFFFLVSGYLLASAALKSKTDGKNMGKETFEFVWKKFKTFFPYVVFTFILALILSTMLGNMTVKKYALSIWDLLLLRYMGFKGAGILHHLWYITAMLFSMFLIYPQIKKWKDNYFYFIAPICVIVLAGIINARFGDLKSPNEWIGFMYKGMPRAYMEMCLGTLLFPLAQKIREIDFTRLGKVFITIFEVLGFLLTVIICHTSGTSYDFILLLLLAISITLAFSEKTLELNLFNNKFFYHLEKMSLVLYFVHLPIRNFIRDYIRMHNLTIGYWYQLIFVLISTFILSYFIYGIIYYLRKKDYFIPHLKKYFIVEKKKTTRGRRKATT